MPDDVELKACPFCGLPGYMFQQGRPFAFCANEECFVQPEASSCNNREDAARLWNTRTPSPVSVEEVARAIQRSAQEDGNDSPVDYGDAEGLAKVAIAALSTRP
jgi:hypothetical protein